MLERSNQILFFWLNKGELSWREYDLPLKTVLPISVNFMHYCHHYLLIIYVTLTRLLSGSAVSLYGLICVGSVLDLDWLLVADNEYYIHVDDLLLTEVTSCWATNNSTFNCSIRTFRKFFSSRRLLHSFSQTQSLALN